MCTGRAHVHTWKTRAEAHVMEMRYTETGAHVNEPRGTCTWTGKGGVEVRPETVTLQVATWTELHDIHPQTPEGRLLAGATPTTIISLLSHQQHDKQNHTHCHHIEDHNGNNVLGVSSNTREKNKLEIMKSHRLRMIYLISSHRHDNE